MGVRADRAAWPIEQSLLRRSRWRGRWVPRSP